MPTPRSGETERQFVDRCMSDEEAKRDFPDNEQRLAFCGSTYRRAQKSQETDMPDEQEFTASAAVVKVDDALGLVMGYAIVCNDGGEPYFDVQGDHIPEDAMMKAATDFMLNSRVAGEMHRRSEKSAEDHGTVVFAWPMTADVAKAFGIEVQKTGLMIAIKPDDGMLEKFRDGTYTGFSIGGARGDDEEVPDDD